MSGEVARVANPVLALLGALALAAALGLGFVGYAPNRLLSGEPVSLWQVLMAAPAWLLALLVLPAGMLLAGVFLKPSRAVHAAVACAASVCGATLLALGGHQAALLGAQGSPLARTSFGTGFWVLMLASLVALADALQRLRLPPAALVGASAAALLPAVVCAASGALDQLSLLKEYFNRQEVFHQALWRHAQIVGWALSLTLLAGWPLGIAAHRNPRFARPLFATLGILQTVPAIA